MIFFWGRRGHMSMPLKDARVLTDICGTLVLHHSFLPLWRWLWLQFCFRNHRIESESFGFLRGRQIYLFETLNSICFVACDRTAAEVGHMHMYAVRSGFILSNKTHVFFDNFLSFSLSIKAFFPLRLMLYFSSFCTSKHFIFLFLDNFVHTYNVFFIKHTPSSSLNLTNTNSWIPSNQYGLLNWSELTS